MRHNADIGLRDLVEGFLFSLRAEGKSNGTLIVFKVQDPERDVIRKRASLITEIHKQFPTISIDELNDARISYFDYHAIVRLKRGS